MKARIPLLICCSALSVPGAFGAPAIHDDGSFVLAFADGRRVASADLKPLPGGPGRLRFADPHDGLEITETMVPASAGRPFSRKIIEAKNMGTEAVPLSSLILLEAPCPAAAHMVGRLAGSPVIAGTTYCGVEHPLAENRVAAGRVSCSLPFSNPLGPGETAAASLVVGEAPDSSQLRRAFGAYIEAERPRPYAPFLHHNTWFNLGFRTPFSERDELALIAVLGRELVEKRGVKLDGFVLDDGWDDTSSLWHFSSSWPDGLRNMAAAAAGWGAAPGIWLSPWGGYGKARQARLAAAAPEGFEVRDGRFSLAGPRYYARFRELCASVVRDDGVAYFKFDGIGGGSPGVVAPSDARDFSAMLRLIRELRSLRPGLYISQTTGTWPSPWWLLWVDNIWRGGGDTGFAGAGTARQRWITFRDAQTYKGVVLAGPLFPLNSVMIHGIVYARHARNLDADPGGDFTDEVRSYFGSGTQLQELYLSPELLTSKNWDDLAAAAKWARANAATLRDTHWIGGDPGKLQVYGWASWSPAKGLITLRNPSDKPASFSLDAQKAFELPRGAEGSFAVNSPFADSSVPLARLDAGKPAVLALAPFQVLVMEASPAAR